MSYALSLLGVVRVWHRPTFVSVEPANFCQLRCPECPVGMGNGHSQGKEDRGVMSYEVWQRILEETHRYVHTIQFYFQGEPLLHRELECMIAEAHDAGLYTIVSTNAQALSATRAEALVRSGLDKIIISLDGLSNDSYGAYRIGGDLQKTLSAMQYIQEHKKRLRRKTPIIEMQCLRLLTNEAEWADMKRLYKRLGADVLVFKTAQFYDYKEGSALMPREERYARYYRGKDGYFHLRVPLRQRIWRQISGVVACWRLWSGCVITIQGNVLPCCFDKTHSYSFGNIMELPLENIWKGYKADDFRRKVLKGSPSICANCTR